MCQRRQELDSKKAQRALITLLLEQKNESIAKDVMYARLKNRLPNTSNESNLNKIYDESINMLLDRGFIFDDINQFIIRKHI